MKPVTMCVKCQRYRPESRMSKNKAFGFEFYTCMSKATCKQYQKENKKSRRCKS